MNEIEGCLLNVYGDAQEPSIPIWAPRASHTGTGACDSLSHRRRRITSTDTVTSVPRFGQQYHPYQPTPTPPARTTHIARPSSTVVCTKQHRIAPLRLTARSSSTQLCPSHGGNTGGLFVSACNSHYFGHADNSCRVNVNDPTLIALVNKLQDVFTTVGVCRRSGSTPWPAGI
jgi:hypothetical protein